MGLDAYAKKEPEPEKKDGSNFWSLKYRPEKLDELIGRKDFKNEINQFSSGTNIPHMIFSGAKGYGKTTAALLFAKKILGDSFEANCKIVYASDPITREERAEIRRQSYVSTSKVGSMAGRQFSWPAFLFSRVKPFVEVQPIGIDRIKILIIKDFHKLQSEQQGFRRLMEKYSQTCRMILITDEISSVIDPILSRCMLFFFNRVDKDQYCNFLSEIIKKEEIATKSSIPEMIYEATNGRIGDGINLLQKAAAESDNKISANNLYRVNNDSISLNLNVLIRSVLQTKIDVAIDKADALLDNGYSFSEIMSGICAEVYHLPLHNIRKAGIISFISDLDFRAIDGNTEKIQLHNAIYQLMDVAFNARKVGV